MADDIKKEFQLGNVKVELSKSDLEKMLQEVSEEEVKFDYPICCKHKQYNIIVLFDSLQGGKVLWTNPDWVTDEYYYQWSSHTRKDLWEEIPYDKERGLYHGQWVWCWDNSETHSVSFRKYNAINRCTFSVKGSPNGFKFENYSATCPKHMKEAFTDLLNNEKALGFLKD